MFPPKLTPLKTRRGVSIPVLVRDPLKRHTFHPPELCEEIKGLVDVTGTQLKRDRRVTLLRPPVRGLQPYAIRLVRASKMPTCNRDVGGWRTHIDGSVIPEREFIEMEYSEGLF